MWLGWSCGTYPREMSQEGKAEMCQMCKRKVNANYSFLLYKHRVLDRSEKEPSLIAAENDDVDPVEEETMIRSF